MQSQGVVAAWAVDVIPTKWQVSSRRRYSCNDTKNAFRCPRLTLGLDEDVSRPVNTHP